MFTAPDCHEETGGSSIPGTLLPKSEKYATEICCGASEVTGAEPWSGAETGCDSGPEESAVIYDVAPSGAGIHVHADGCTFG